MVGKVGTSAIRLISNIVVVLAFGLMVYACYRRYRDTGSINWFGLLVVNSLFIAMYIARRDATADLQIDDPLPYPVQPDDAIENLDKHALVDGGSDGEFGQRGRGDQQPGAGQRSDRCR